MQPFDLLHLLHLSPIVAGNDLKEPNTPQCDLHSICVDLSSSPNKITPLRDHVHAPDANTYPVSSSPSQLPLRYNRLQLNFGVGKCTRTSRPTTFGEIGRRRVSPRENKGKKPKNNNN